MLYSDAPRERVAEWALELDTLYALLAERGLHPVQAAFVEAGAIQCGFCSPGMILSATALLRDNPDPTEHEIREWLEGNICRCTGYHNIVKAIDAAAKAM